MINEKEITLTPLQDEEVALCEQWLKKDFIYERFCPRGEEEFQSWMDEINGRNDVYDSRNFFMVHCDSVKIGFCLLLDLNSEPEYVAELYPDLTGQIAKNDALELGYCIGEEDYLAKGIGKIIVSKLEEEAKKFGAKIILADPDETNIPSVKVLLANSFEKVKDGDYRKELI